MWTPPSFLKFKGWWGPTGYRIPFKNTPSKDVDRSTLDLIIFVVRKVSGAWPADAAALSRGHAAVAVPEQRQHSRVPGKSREGRVRGEDA